VRSKVGSQFVGRFTIVLAAAVFTVFAVGCGRPFDVKTAPGFVELDDQAPAYDYRATTPEGVVVSVRAIANHDERGDLAFWTRAITLQLRDVSGYALLDTADAKSSDGTLGKKLTFGHDEDGKPYTYTITIYMAQGRLFIVEAGGTKAQMDRARASVTWMEQQVRVRCGSIVAPVLASHTCNRW